MDKLELLTAAAQFDVCGYGGLRSATASPLRFIHKVAIPGRGTVCLFKVLMTNVCVNDCVYCVNQTGRDIPRSTFQPDELARLFMDLHSKKLAHGLFLTSGIAGNASRAMESMLDTVTILRRRYEFKGYIHLKVLPGASFDCIEEGCKLADRVSVNMEAPTAEHLSRLSQKKDLYRDIVERMRWIKQISQANEKAVPSGQTTQFVVGAAGETDRELLKAVNVLYDELELKRVCFSAFVPVLRSRSEGFQPAPPIRAHRLYQTDWLLRIYGFSPAEVELALDMNSNLSLKKDPKLVIARKQPWLFPADINNASYNELLRIPGIGPISAKRIVATRQNHSIDSLEQLRRMGVVTKRATPFLWFQGLAAFEKQTSFLPELDNGCNRNLMTSVNIL